MDTKRNEEDPNRWTKVCDPTPSDAQYDMPAQACLIDTIVCGLAFHEEVGAELYRLTINNSGTASFVTTVGILARVINRLAAEKLALLAPHTGI